MSCRVSTTSLIPGACVVGNRGLGVLGSVIRTTTNVGENGAGFLYNDLTIADDGREIYGLIITPPSSGTFTTYEDGSFELVGASNGSHSFTYRLFSDGVDLGTATVTMTIGVVSAVPVNSSAPTIGGTPVQGQILTISNGVWTNTPSSYSYQWYRSGIAIVGATASSYQVSGADIGNTLRAGVVATNGIGPSIEAFSLQTSQVTSPVDTSAPILTNPTCTKAGLTTAVGTVSTNEGTGVLYRLISVNSSESVDTIKSSPLVTDVTTTGVQAVSFAGLMPSTTYYAHFVHRDAAGNDSLRATSANFTTDSSNTPTPTETGVKPILIAVSAAGKVSVLI